MWLRQWTRSRKAAVSVMFAAAAIPMVGLVGLAVDFGIWNQTNATLSVAANVAALTAVKLAANEQTAAVPDLQVKADGTAAGQQWFAAEVGLASKIGTEGVNSLPNAAVTITTGTTVTANVAFSGFVPSVFGSIFGTAMYPITGSATAAVTFAPFLDVEILLDNSGSMEIGAGATDIAHLQAITPCYPALLAYQGNNKQPANYQAPGAFYAPGFNSNLEDQSYSAYSYNGYDGPVAAPAIAYDPPMMVQNFNENTQPSCQGVLPQSPQGSKYPYPMAGPPCAFACHFDTSNPGNSGGGNDFYALARSTIGQLNPITLRFDLVKAAVNQVISTMQSDNIPDIDNLDVGVFTFADQLARVYPAPGCGGGLACQAGNDWNTAISDVGGPPTLPNGADTGIQPYTGGNNGNSDFHDTMTLLASPTYLTASGDGTTASNPRKVLFLVTDGLVDYTPAGGARTYGTVNPADCNLFKNMGYTIYVVYTPYYPVMNDFYISNIMQYAEPQTNSPISQALQACSSDPVADYVSAADSAGLNAALQKFLLAALREPVKFTH